MPDSAKTFLTAVIAVAGALVMALLLADEATPLHTSEAPAVQLPQPQKLAQGAVRAGRQL